MKMLKIEEERYSYLGWGEEVNEEQNENDSDEVEQPFKQPTATKSTDQENEITT